MLGKWTKLLPVFIVQWLARKSCEEVYWEPLTYVTAYDDILILKNKGKG